ncbi:related to cytochrome P450 [Phialocephala subalpina]|uniref:Related to cytochrome P450 n=1 Tax=Phialocephala subalpina TaxID=576137 RepID=A0A1L7XE72_9HELO|nr:related to cytochrome P450 [Phialocephala subalpina]
MAFIERSLVERMDTVLISGLLTFTGFWLATLAIYRIYLSPLSKFPGPKLAAFTSILHPDKTMKFDIRWDSPGAAQVTGPHELHRIRRTALNPFFSKHQVLLLWPYIREKRDKFCRRVDEYVETKKPLNLSKAFGCFSIDVVTEYAFGQSYNDLDNEHFFSGLSEVMDELLGRVHVITHLPWILSAVRALPEWVQGLLNPGMIVVRKYHGITSDKVRDIKEEKQKGEKMAGHKTILHELLESDLPSQELSVKRLSDESNILVGAGSDTIKHTLEVAAFHIVDNAMIQKTLREELVAAMPSRFDELTWAELEKLPYLSVVIQEALRLSYGISQRSPRISPKEGLQYKGKLIPAGFLVSMDAVHMHHNENIFPNSNEFSPERWLEDDGSGSKIISKRLQRYNIAFSRGTRQCVGMNLAYAELYLMLSTLFRRYEMQLYETGVDSVELWGDFFLPKAKPGTEGVRVLMKRLSE